MLPGLMRSLAAPRAAASMAIVVLLLMMGSLFSWLRQDLAMTFADISDNITDAVIVGK